MPFKLGTRTIQLDTPFTHNDIQYPANWIRLATESEKSAIGLVWEADAVRADDRFYWDGNINNPKDLDGLKSQFIAQVKTTAGSILAQTDWMVIRKAERNVDIPSAVATYRASVVAKADELETAISAVTTVEQLIALDLSFPSDK
jgi:hypothetical protein